MKIRLNLYRRTVAGKIAFGRNVVTKMTGHATFTDPVPSLADMAGAIDALELAAIEAADGGKSKTALRKQKELELDALLRRLAHWIENQAGDDEALILSSGMDIRRPAVPVGLPAAPDNFRFSLPGSHGRVDLSWSPVAGVYTYELQQRAGNDGEWVKVVSVTRASHALAGLTSGQVYWFRVAAIAAAGQSGWSNPVMVYAP